MLSNQPVYGCQLGSDEDQEEILDGLGSFKTWSEGFGDKINALTDSVQELPFVVESLDNVWNVTGTDISGLIDSQIIAPLDDFFSNGEDVTPDDVVEIDGITVAPSSNVNEFIGTIVLDIYSETASLNFENDGLGGGTPYVEEGSPRSGIGLVVPDGAQTFEPLTLSGDTTLKFVFGLDENSDFFIRDPGLSATIALDHNNFRQRNSCPGSRRSDQF